MMPNRTIYVSDNDLPIYERAQELSHGNLSATITQALRRFVNERELHNQEFSDIVLMVGKNVYTHKQFNGRRLARGTYSDADTKRDKVIEIYQTAKGRFVLYTRNKVNWAAWTAESNKDSESDEVEDRDKDKTKRQRSGGWNTPRSFEEWNQQFGSRSDLRSEFTFEVFETIEELKALTPAELYDAALHNLDGNSIQVLDI